MARAVWQGYIVLGQLGIPVRLYSGLKSREPRFVQLHESDGSPVERQLRCKAEQREIPPSEVIRAVEISPGQYVTLSEQELRITTGSSFKSLAIQQFCESDAIATIYYERPFYSVAAKGGERAYALLREVLDRTKKQAVVTYTMYNREHIGTLQVHEDLLLVQQLRYAAEISPRDHLKTPTLPKSSPMEIEALSNVVDRFSGPLHLADYHDGQAERLQQLVERKAKGLRAPREERIAPHATPEARILNALQSTLGDRQALSEPTKA